MSKREYRLVLTNSEVTAYRECPRRWSYRYEDGLQHPRDVDIKTVGSLFHAGMEAACRTWRETWERTRVPPTVDEVARAAREGLRLALAAERELVEAEVGDDRAPELLARLDDDKPTLDFMVERACRSLPLDAQVPILIEEPLSAVVYRGIRFEGKPDLVTADLRDRRIWIWDWKTTAYDPKAFDGRLRLDTQSAGYVRLVRDHLQGKRVRDRLRHLVPWIDEAPAATGPFVWHVVRRKRPATPYVTKLTKKQATSASLKAAFEAQESGGPNAGMVSTARGTDTTAEVYLTALQAQAERGLEITDDQRAMFERLRSQGDTFMSRTERYITEQESQVWLDELRVEARRIRESRRSSEARTRNPSTCSMPWSPPCAYREVCVNDTPESRAPFLRASSRHPELRVIQ